MKETDEEVKDENEKFSCQNEEWVANDPQHGHSTYISTKVILDVSSGPFSDRVDV